MALIIWGDEPREVPGLGLLTPNQELLVKEELAKQFIRQAFARPKRARRKKK